MVPPNRSGTLVENHVDSRRAIYTFRPFDDSVREIIKDCVPSYLNIGSERDLVSSNVIMSGYAAHIISTNSSRVKSS